MLPAAPPGFLAEALEPDRLLRGRCAQQQTAQDLLALNPKREFQFGTPAQEC